MPSPFLANIAQEQVIRSLACADVRLTRRTHRRAGALDLFSIVRSAVAALTAGRSGRSSRRLVTEGDPAYQA